MAKGGLFAEMGPPEEDDDDYSDDALPALDEEEEELAPGAGPFEAYCEIALDANADYQARCDALRQAILTVLEEQ